MLLAEFLEMHGYAVKTASTMVSALRLIDAEAFDVIVSDIGLPDGSGLELMRHIAASHPVPGLALSGYGSEKDVQAARAAGFYEHLTKPVNPNHLVAVLAKVLGEGVTR